MRDNVKDGYFKTYENEQLMLGDILYIVFWLLCLYSLFLAARLIFGETESRNPISTLGWMVVLLAVPVLGLVVYVVFGQNMRQKARISKLSIRNEKSRDLATEQELVADTLKREMKDMGGSVFENVTSLMKLLYGNGKSLLYHSSDVKILSEPQQTFNSMFDDLNNAKDHIHIEFYIISNDSVGNKLREILERKAREGLRVRVIYDYWGSTIDKKYRKSLKDAGVRLHSFFPPKFPFLLRHINYRNHRKIVVIDGKIGYTGGVNIADRYLMGNNLGIWRDTMARFEGPVEHGLQETFLGDWFFIDKKKHQKPRYFPEFSLKTGYSNLIQIADSGPDTPYKAILQGMIFMITTAQKYVYIQTPDYMPPVELETAIKVSALRGVDVRILIPESSDASMAQSSNASYVEAVLEAGAKVYWYKGGFLHSKAIVCDNYISSVGTSNMDFRSFEQNFEVNAFIYDRKIATELRDNFLKDLKSSEEIDLERWKRRSKGKRIKESFSRLFSPAM